MTTITISQLHDHTEEWVRRAAQDGEIIVTDRGQVVARILPSLQPHPMPFANRQLLPEFVAIQQELSGGTDSTTLISDDRADRIP
ncbi:MAG: type II toxin-antitoxin system prevent-host-death family antitoxin [Planctomycetota bacterium]